MNEKFDAKLVGEEKYPFLLGSTTGLLASKERRGRKPKKSSVKASKIRSSRARSAARERILQQRIATLLGEKELLLDRIKQFNRGRDRDRPRLTTGGKK